MRLASRRQGGSLSKNVLLLWGDKAQLRPQCEVSVDYAGARRHSQFLAIARRGRGSRSLLKPAMSRQ
jgi:hypothetical protein